MKVYCRILMSRFDEMRRSEAALKKIRKEVIGYSEGGALNDIQTIQAILRRVETLTKQVRKTKGQTE